MNNVLNLPPITVPAHDHSRLMRTAQELAEQGHPLAAPLLQELHRATVCPASELPGDVVTLDTFVTYRMAGEDTPDKRMLIHPDDRMCRLPDACDWLRRFAGWVRRGRSGRAAGDWRLRAAWNRAPGWHRRQVDLMRVLHTRPSGQAEELGAILSSHGVEWLGEPLLRIVPVAWDPGVLAGRAALLVTSANASRELLRVAGVRRDCPVFAVGPATAEPLRAAGFSNVQAAGGTAVSLIAHVRRHADPRAGRLLHVSGRDIALDLGTGLARPGLQSTG